MDTQPQKSPLHPNSQQQGSSSFSHQLFQGSLDEALASLQKSIHEDVRNLHIEVLRQSHMQEVCIYLLVNFFIFGYYILFYVNFISPLCVLHVDANFECNELNFGNTSRDYEGNQIVTQRNPGTPPAAVSINFLLV